MAFAAAEAAVEVAGFAAVALDGGLDEGEGVVEAVFEFWGDDVVAQGGFGAGDTFGELEDEVAFLDALGDID